MNWNGDEDAEHLNMPNAYTANRFFARRNARREKMLRKMEAMRDAKARNRLARPVEHMEPRRSRVYPLELGVRDKRTGETAWTDFRSIRDAIRRLSVVKRFYV